MVSMDQTTQTRLLYFGLAAVVIGGTVYSFWGTDLFTQSKPERSSKPSSSAGFAKPKEQHHFELRGSPKTWSEDDMKKYLSTRNMASGHNPGRAELLAMVESKMHEPKSTGFDDPQEWSARDMKEWLVERKMAVGHNPSREELLAMVESKMHEPI